MAHSQATVEKWLARIFKSEGGLSMRRDDPGNWTGGRVGIGDLKGTKFGIASNTYPRLDIPNLTKAEAANIYIRDFLTPLRADRLEDGVAFQLFDFAVNSGPSRAIKGIQWALKVPADGIIGPVTLAALASKSESDLVMLTIAYRLDFMANLSNWEAAGRGWAHRIADMLRYGAEDTE